MPTEAAHTPNRAAAVLIFLVFSLAFAASQFHRTSGGVIAPELSRELGLAAEALGVVAGALFVTSGLSQWPIGLLLDRFGARRTLPLMLAFVVAGSVWFAEARSLESLIGARLLIGIGNSASMISAFAVFARWFPADRFATVSAWMLAVGSIGGLCATTPLAGLVELIGWRLSIHVVAGLTALLALAAIFIVRDAPPGYREEGAPPAGFAENLRGLAEILRTKRFRYILAMGLVAFAPAMTILGLWGGPYLKDVHGLDGVARGHVLLAMVATSIVGILVFGPLDRYFRTRKRIVAVAAGLMVATLASLAVLARPPLWLAVALFIAVAFLQQFYVVLAAHSRASFPDHMIGRAGTTLNMTSIIGIALMQGLFGLIVGAFPGAHGAAPALAYRLGFGAMAVSVALSLVLYTRSTDVRPR